MYSNLYADSSSIDKTNKTITLSTAWNKATIPAGTYLSQGSSGNNYKYLLGGRITATTEWTTFKGGYDGVDYTGKNDMYKLPPGTAFAKFGMFLNYSGVANEKVWLTNIVVKEDVYSAVEEKADKTYVDTELAKKSDKNHTHSGYLTSIPSEYVTETEIGNMVFITIDDIDNIVMGYSSVVKYTITNNLTNVTTNNTTLSVEPDDLYKAMLTPSSGYTINSVKITMGGVDITSDVYFDGSITIGEVTDNVVITATAVRQ